ncbi:MAG: putative assembly protein [Candidatus Accumulibacter appositus]|uniref:Putative assembly protein n=1 Tax=Candidatus Accumulibacter appositus TaxID=1454003 RepID=A0A011PZP1_9PROT|nr:AsmA family protein [Accumulibacter sp.]EXI82375.1 MAG: putative assembly protein [Candidatus Accumulibacter appositus]HRF03477.1 AsmA family protein [Accumulibacter sp.]
MSADRSDGAGGRRRLLLVAAAAAALLALAMALSIALFDVNRYKPEIAEAVRAHSGRTLHVNGDIELSFFPGLAIDLPASTLSARDSEAEFLSFSSAHIEVALLPLLWQEVLVESIQLRGARATMTLREKHSDTVSEGDEARLAPAETAAPATTADTPTAPSVSAAASGDTSRQAHWEIGQLLLSDAAISLHDGLSGKTIVLSAINLETGRLAPKTQLPLALKAHIAVSKPEVAGEIEITASVNIDIDRHDPANSTLAASDLKLGFTGSLGEQALRASLTASSLFRHGQAFRASQVEVAVQADAETLAAGAALAGTRSLDATVRLDSIAGPSSALVGEGFLLTATRRDGPASISARVSGALNASIEGQTLSLPQFDAEIGLEDPRLPGGQARLPLSGALTLDARQERASLKLASRASDASFEASIELANFAKPEVGFDLQADRLNLDRYLPAAPVLTAEAAARREPAAAEQAASSEPGKGRNPAVHIVRTSTSAPTPPPASASAASEPAFKLAPLGKLRLDGQLKIAQLQAHGIKAAVVHARVHSADGSATLAPVSARLYGGQADGDLTLDGQSPRLALKLALKDVDFGALAHDAGGHSDLEGRGNVDLELSSTGQSRVELTRAAQGTARFALRDVALVGIDLSAVLGQVKDILSAGGTQSGKIDTSRLTRLTHLSATVKLAEGIAHNDDLDGAAPRLALGGYGQFDLLANELDYTLRVMMAANPAESSKLLRALEGVPIPVQVSGPANELRYSISLKNVAADVLKRHSDDIGAALIDEAERLLDRLFGGDKSK